MAADELDPTALAVMLSLLPVLHPLLVAARLGVEVAEARNARRRALRDASHDVAGHPAWRGYADRRVTYEELQRRRATVGPLAVRV
jgi:hypothetical protein